MVFTTLGTSALHLRVRRVLIHRSSSLEDSFQSASAPGTFKDGVLKTPPFRAA